MLDGRHRADRRSAQAQAEAPRPEERGARRALQARRAGDASASPSARICGCSRSRRICPARPRRCRSTSTCCSRPTLPILYVLFTTFILTGVSNAVNLTDGLDGLAAGLSAIAFAVLAIFAYLIGRVDASHYLGIFYLRNAGELTIYCTGDVRRADRLPLVQHLSRRRSSWATPARSPSAGRWARWRSCSSRSSCSSSSAPCSSPRRCRCCCSASCSSIAGSATASSTRSEHRVFLRAPLHHHFEVKGWSEQQVVVRFWIIGIIGAFLALSTLKVR